MTSCLDLLGSLSFIISSRKQWLRGLAGSSRAFGERIACGSSTITSRAVWGCEPQERLERISVTYPPSFYMHLKDPHVHWEMIQALENRFRSRSAASIASLALSRVIGYTPAEMHSTTLIYQIPDDLDPFRVPTACIRIRPSMVNT